MSSPISGLLPFVHEPLDRSLQQIRLVSITPSVDGPVLCKVRHFNLASNPTPEYRALSYVWGPPEFLKDIVINGQSFSVRPNLYDFLLAFRARLSTFSGSSLYEDEIQWLWIDQLCIDQSVVEERNHQVQMMSEIYRRASYVYVWLGRSDFNTEAVLTSIKLSYRNYHDNKVLSRKRRRELADQSVKRPAKRQSMCNDEVMTPWSVSALKYFFRNPYWSRLWIVQEIMLARYIRVLCGETLLSWDEMSRFCSSGIQELPEEAQRAVPPQVKWLAEHALSAQTYEYYNLLWTFSKSECQDPRDKVYALQGILGQEERIAIDYAKSEREVFRDAAVDIIRKASIASRSRHQSNLYGLDYRQPSDKIFADAVEILVKEARRIVQPRLVETLVSLGEAMGLNMCRAGGFRYSATMAGKQEAAEEETSYIRFNTWRQYSAYVASEYRRKYNLIGMDDSDTSRTGARSDSTQFSLDGTANLKGPRPDRLRLYEECARLTVALRMLLLCILASEWDDNAPQGTTATLDLLEDVMKNDANVDEEIRKETERILEDVK